MIKLKRILCGITATTLFAMTLFGCAQGSAVADTASSQPQATDTSHPLMRRITQQAAR